ncbi:FAD-dependent monooxygenase [Rhizobium sp. BE258]|uniref:FAD-dependent monooxygenase n=1 Tax=Rhizobium sp. BE258 TaxID=2817722 RepID=UPI00286C14C7|nr:FAD-dependent monooxygenase [Rhizobium sp. BE258]
MQVHRAALQEVQARRWIADRHVLIGDAAHATSPSVAQGAAMALEDWVVLANILTPMNLSTERWSSSTPFVPRGSRWCWRNRGRETGCGRDRDSSKIRCSGCQATTSTGKPTNRLPGLSFDRVMKSQRQFPARHARPWLLSATCTISQGRLTVSTMRGRHYGRTRRRGFICQSWLQAPTRVTAFERALRIRKTMLTIQLHACETSRYTPHLFGRSRRPRVGDQEAGT